MDKQQLLDQIAADIVTNNVCPDLAKQATNLVPGDGNPDADIVFIGEAPGKNEDEQGKPFVGAAGKFLNEMLASIGLQREDIFITNIVKYRPPNNRDPLPDEKQAFWPFLVRQLEVIQPRIVVTLGRHSMEYFLPGQKISQIHGQPKRLRMAHLGISHRLIGGQYVSGVQGSGEQRTEAYEQYSEGAAEPITQQSATKLDGSGGSAGAVSELVLVILPLYHPAAALYNGSMRQTLIQDFSTIPAIIKQLTT
jgi:DNA polymerase